MIRLRRPLPRAAAGPTLVGPMPNPTRSLPPFVAVACAAMLAVVLAPFPPAGARAASGPKGTGSIEVRVIALGEPVPGVAVQARPTGGPGGEVWREDSTAIADTSDAQGKVRFTGLAPGRYHVVGHCGRLPGDIIAGNLASKVDVVPRHTARATLTLRRGGRIVGRAMEGERGLSGIVLQTEATDALASSCPMLEARNPGPDGRFAVGKVPVGSYVWVKAIRPLGRGEIQVWKDFRIARAETVTGTWNFPPIDSTQLGSARIGVRLADAGPADRGRLELLHLDKEGWRYSLGFDFTEADSVTLLPALPPGEYTVRAMATPGVRRWWNAASDTLVVAPGARHTKILVARLRP